MHFLLLGVTSLTKSQTSSLKIRKDLKLSLYLSVQPFICDSYTQVKVMMFDHVGFFAPSIQYKNMQYLMGWGIYPLKMTQMVYIQCRVC